MVKLNSIIVITMMMLTHGNILFAQCLKVDYNNVGNVNDHENITLVHQFDGILPMVSICIWELQSNETVE